MFTLFVYTNNVDILKQKTLQVSNFKTASNRRFQWLTGYSICTTACRIQYSLYIFIGIRCHYGRLLESGGQAEGILIGFKEGYGLRDKLDCCWHSLLAFVG